MNPIAKMLTSVATSTTKSLIGTGIKKTVNDLIKRYTAKKPEQIEKEIIERLGYASSHYKLGRNQEVIFRPSSVFMHEWMMNSPEMKGKIIKDEEAGISYYCGELLSNTTKVKIINDFMKATGAQSPSLSGHFDQAMKLWEPTDHIGEKFKKHFSGWKEGTPSVIDGFLSGCFGSALTTDPEYAHLLFRRWITGAARRVMNPGSVLDGCLTFQGAPGVGKTAFFRNLLSEPFNERCGEVYCDVKNPRQFAENLIGLSIANMDELTVLDHEKSVETLKLLLSAQWFSVRLAWRRDPQRFNLRNAFGATTNKTQFINDAALKRRLWIVELNDSKKIDFTYLLANREALWKEAMWCANKEDTCVMTLEEQIKIESLNQKFVVS